MYVPHPQPLAICFSKSNPPSVTSLRYRRLRCLFSAAPKWASFDPFATQKLSTFRSSATGIMQLASSIEAMRLTAARLRLTAEQAKKRGDTAEENLEIEWERIVSVCLWGNATVGSIFHSLLRRSRLMHVGTYQQDLSLLTSLTHEEIQALQSVERGSKFILKNDSTWNHLKDLKSKRIDIVLDNVSFHHRGSKRCTYD